MESTPSYSTFKLTKYGKNVKLTTFLMEKRLNGKTFESNKLNVRNMPNSKQNLIS